MLFFCGVKQCNTLRAFRHYTGSCLNFHLGAAAHAQQHCYFLFPSSSYPPGITLTPPVFPLRPQVRSFGTWLYTETGTTASRSRSLMWWSSLPLSRVSAGPAGSSSWASASGSTGGGRRGRAWATTQVRLIIVTYANCRRHAALLPQQTMGNWSSTQQIIMFFSIKAWIFYHRINVSRS